MSLSNRQQEIIRDMASGVVSTIEQTGRVKAYINRLPTSEELLYLNTVLAVDDCTLESTAKAVNGYVMTIASNIDKDNLLFTNIEPYIKP